MDDSCAVCAGALEWVAYGTCGHREVCSTCIVRLRFICNDKCCCICKSLSNFIFVTKALGNYTTTINDFSAFPSNPKEGRVGEYWFHEGSQAYFDDFDHYMIVKAMCKLSCTVCDRKNDQKNRGGSKKAGDFNCIDQLKIHLFHQHKLFMCSLCLEGRKIFISEQKLYNRAQLSQHVKTGDSVVDGSENERGGFMGHPTCHFCQNPFYGDNELYLHMSTEHFSCHICQRRHPGQYEYHNNYDDLEIHFRQEHFLCEDEACLEKKFIVFATESEMKRHDAMEHGGRMSHSKRNTALQIPTSFQYQRSAEQDQRDRGRGKRPNLTDHQLPMPIQDSLGTRIAVRLHDASLSTQAISSRRETSEIDSTVNPFDLLATPDSPPSSSRRKISASTLLEESSFPPLPIVPSSSRWKSRNTVGSSENTMAARLRQRNTVKVINSSRASPAAGCHSNSSGGVSYQSRPVPISLSSSLSVPQNKVAANDDLPSSVASSLHSQLSVADDLVSSVSLANSSRTQSSTSKASPAERETLGKTVSDSHVDMATTSKHPLLKPEDVQSAKKALVERIRAALDFDEDKFAAFKVISVEYRQDLIDTAEYLAYIHQFGLEHLVLELAILCPNAQKQRELVEIHKSNTRRNGSNENGSSIKNGGPKSNKSSKKGKEKCEDNGICSSENALAGNLENVTMNLQVNHKPPSEEVGLSSKDTCHSAKGKSKIVVDQESNLNLSMELRNENGQPANGSSMRTVGPAGGGNKPRKKASKFLKNRLGETVASALPDNSNLGVGLDENKEKAYRKKHPPELLPVHGVWRNGGGRRLVMMTQKDCKR